MTETILICSALAVIVFAIQYALCRKTTSKVIKCIPAYFICTAYLVAILLYVLDFLDGAGGVAIGSIFAFIILIAASVALVADIAAWLVHRLSHKLLLRLVLFQRMCCYGFYGLENAQKD